MNEIILSDHAVISMIHRGDKIIIEVDTTSFWNIEVKPDSRASRLLHDIWQAQKKLDSLREILSGSLSV